MNISCEISTFQIGSINKMRAMINLLRNVSMDTPVFFKCKCPNTSMITNYLVVPKYFSNGFFHCNLLAIDNPEALKGNPSKGDVIINIDYILSWETLNGKPFLNFGTGFVTEEYTQMAIPA